jgi:ribonuclease D
MNNTRFKAKITRAEIEGLPVKKFAGEIFFIDSLIALHKFLPELNNETILGFDTETRPAFKRGTFNHVSLMQLSTSERAFLFRLNMIGLPDELCSVLSNPNIYKAGVAIHDDLGGLKRLKKFVPEGFIDLQEYVKEFGIEDNSLKKLAANILGIRISKRQQTSNWENNSLSQAQIEYAATDAWVCHEIFHLLHTIKYGNGKLG